MRLWELFPSSVVLSVIVLLHYEIVRGLVLLQSRHLSQVYGGRLTWHINCYLPRWMGLAREQMRRAVTWHCFWQTPYIPSHLSPLLSLYTVLLLLPLMSYCSCQRFCGSAVLPCMLFMHVCMHSSIPARLEVTVAFILRNKRFFAQVTCKTLKLMECGQTKCTLFSLYQA